MAFIFLLRAKSSLGKIAANSKVKADALWEEQGRLIYWNWNRKCGLRMTVRKKNNVAWLIVFQCSFV